jgi:hypothetical protein
MSYQKRTKGTMRWRRIGVDEARSLVGEDFDLLERGIVQETPYAYVRRIEGEQLNLPGVGEGTGAYGRE